MRSLNATVSPLLIDAINQLVEKEGRSHERLARTVIELSRLFTKERAELSRPYLDEPTSAAAYLSYFLPVNLSKVQALLDELPEDWHFPSGNRSFRVLDLGTGPGTGPLAVIDWLNQHAADSLKNLTVIAVDASTQALHQARRLWTAYSRLVSVGSPNLILHEGDLTRSAHSGWHTDVVHQAPYDLIIVANCLNELFGQTLHAIKERSRLIADFLELLAPRGTLMIVEPALRETSRSLHQVRDRLLDEKRCTVYSPCLHDKNCPALLNPDDWCHEERAWKPPASIQRIDREVGFIKDALKFSYLLLRTDGRTITERGTQTFRMVSELRMLKGDTRAWLCNESGRHEVGRLDRAQSKSNSAWDECQRGAIVRIDALRKNDGSSLARIPSEGTVEIVRSA